MSDKKYESLKIENIVASGVIAESIDLVEFSQKVENCELNKKRFPGAVYGRSCDRHEIVKSGRY
jgi:transcription initiation factor TFIID TATA-box-binding protein